MNIIKRISQNPKKILTKEQIKKIIDSCYEMDPKKLNLQQKSLILTTITFHFHNLMKSLTGKIQIFIQTLIQRKNTETTKKKPRNSTLKKKGKYVNPQQNLINIERMMDQELNSSKNTLFELKKDEYTTIKKQQQMNDEILQTALQLNLSTPKFQKKLQEFNQSKKNNLNIIDSQKENNQLLEHHYLIQTQQISTQYKQILKFQDPMIKNQSKTRATRKKKQLRRIGNISIDQKIDIGFHNQSNDLQILMTKTKRIKYTEKFNYQYLENNLTSLNPTLLKLEQNIGNFLPQLKHFEESYKEIEEVRYKDFEFDDGLIYMRSQSNSKAHSTYDHQELGFLSLDELNYASSQQFQLSQIQMKIKLFISHRLQIEHQVCLNTIMDEKSLKKQSRALFFYQVLACNFKMKQTSCATFSPIYMFREN